MNPANFSKIIFLAWFVIVTLGCDAPLAVTPPAQSISQTGTPPATRAGGAGTTLPFADIESGESLVANVENPALQIGNSPEFVAGLIEKFDNPETRAKISAVDLNENQILVAWAGMVGSSGYGIKIRDIVVTSDQAQVFVNLTTPAPGQMTSSVIAYPYDIVSISLDSHDFSTPIRWILTDDDGKVLAETIYP